MDPQWLICNGFWSEFFIVSRSVYQLLFLLGGYKKDVARPKIRVWGCELCGWGNW